MNSTNDRYPNEENPNNGLEEYPPPQRFNPDGTPFTPPPTQQPQDSNDQNQWAPPTQQQPPATDNRYEYGAPDTFTADQFRTNSFQNIESEPTQAIPNQQIPGQQQQNPGYQNPTQANPAVNPGYDTQANPAVNPGYNTQANPAVQPGQYQAPGEQYPTQANPAVNPGYNTQANPAVNPGYDTQANPAVDYGYPGNNEQTAMYQAQDQQYGAPTMQQPSYGDPSREYAPVTDRRPGNKPKAIPPLAILGGAFLMAMVAGLVIYFLFFRDSDEVVTPDDTTQVTDATVAADDTTAPVDDTVAPAATSEIFLTLSDSFCSGSTVQECAVSGPMDASQDGAYQIRTTSSEEVQIEATLNGEPIDASVPFGLGGSTGKQIFEITVNGEQSLTINQFGFTNQADSFGVILSTHARGDMEPVITAYDTTVTNHPTAIVTEGLYLDAASDEEKSQVIIYAGGFADQAAAEAYCGEKGLEGDACRVSPVAVS